MKMEAGDEPKLLQKPKAPHVGNAARIAPTTTLSIEYVVTSTKPHILITTPSGAMDEIFYPPPLI